MPLTEDERANLRVSILRRIRAADNAASAGLHGSAAYLWKLLVRDSEADITMLTLALFERVALGSIGPDVRRILIHSDLLAIPRPDGRVRPVEVPSLVRKIGVGALMDVLAPEADRAAGPFQFGLRSKDGCVLAFSALQHALRSEPHKVVASIDVKGAHASINRAVLEGICQEDAPRLAHFMRLWYHEESPKTWRGTESCDMRSGVGVGQGFPEAGPLFCAGLGRLIRRLLEGHPSIRAVAFQDDTYLIDTLDNILAALRDVRLLWQELGLEINDLKLKLYTADPATRARAPPDLQPRFVDQLGVLGQRLATRIEDEGVDFLLTPTGAGTAMALAAATAQLAGLGTRLESLTAAGLPLAVAHRIWMHASGGAFTHLLAGDFCTAQDLAPLQDLQRRHVQWLTGRDPNRQDMLIARLPLRDGGIAVPDYESVAPLTFVSAQSRVLPEVARALGVASVEELLASRPDLEAKLTAAKGVLTSRGAPRPHACVRGCPRRDQEASSRLHAGHAEAGPRCRRGGAHSGADGPPPCPGPARHRRLAPGGHA